MILDVPYGYFPYKWYWNSIKIYPMMKMSKTHAPQKGITAE